MEMARKAIQEAIEEKVQSGERLTPAEGLWLMNCDDLLWLGQLAREVKERKTGDYVFFNVNRHLNLTNVCASRCRFCAFGRGAGDEGAYVMSVEEAVERARAAAPLGITELHIVSALHPDLPFEYYVEVLRQLRDALPGVHLQAFTAVEIDYFTRLTGWSVEKVLATLQEAGLGSLPGGGAEVFSPRVREAVCPRKASGQRWLEIMRVAHRLGLRSNATMLYGHIETPEERVEHLIALRDLQDETGGFQSFIPLPFHPENTGLAHLPRTTAFEDLRVMAVARLMLDNFDHIKAFWIMLGVPLAQVSLEFGVDDLDGTVVEERITHAAGARTAESISKEELIRLIREAGRVPVERDTVYNVLRVYGP